MLHWSLVLCLLWAVTAHCNSCDLPDPHSYCNGNCAPEDRLIDNRGDQCHTSFRFRSDHVYDPTWVVIFDSYDYQTLAGEALLGKEFDNDGDEQGDQWTNQGGICQFNLRVCAWSLGPQDNWLFSNHIKYPPGSTNIGGGLSTEIYFQVSYRFTQCNGGCTNNYFNLYRIDTDSIIASDIDQRDNYTPFFGTGTETTTSRFQQEGRRTVYKTVPYVINSPSSNGFHFALRDSGTCGSVNRFYFYYTPCMATRIGLVIYPELVRPPTGSPPNVGQACCAPNSHIVGSPDFEAHSDVNCTRNVKCICDGGYRLSASGLECEECPAGTFRTHNSMDTVCEACPKNTITTEVQSSKCACVENHFRNKPNEDPHMICCPAPSAPTNPLCPNKPLGDSMSVSWSPPSGQPCRDDTYYIVEYQPITSTGDDVASNSTNATEYNIIGLEPVTKYRIRVFSENGVSDQDQRPGIRATRRVEIVCETGEGRPEKPERVQRIGSVLLWQPPTKPNGVITGYQISVTDPITGEKLGKSEDLSFDTFAYDLSNLITNALGIVEVKVRAETSVGYGEYSTSDSPVLYTVLPERVISPTVVTPLLVPGPVRDLRTTTTSSTSIDLAWTRPEIFAGPDFHYTYQINDPDGLISDRIIKLPLSASSSRLNFTVNGLQPVTAYVIRITTHNENTGQYQKNETSRRVDLLVKTSEGAPSAPKNVRFFCPMFVWELPATPNGQIQSYDIEIRGSEAGTLKNTTSENFFRISDPEGEFRGLILIKVRARTAAGVGPYNEERTEDSLECSQPPPPTSCPTCPTPGITCNELSPPTNGRVTAECNTATYTCNSGYTLMGLSSRNCVSLGSAWTGTAPTCVSAIECPELPNPTNGIAIVFSHSIGGTARYFCNVGYTLIGSQSRTCQSSGVWSGPAPTCVAVECPSLTNPTNGIVTVSTRLFNSKATYSCNTGYTLSGSSSRTCLSNGQWSGSAPSCQPVCPSLTNPANGRVTVTRRSVGGRATYTCNSGYTLIGSSSRTCQFNGVWSEVIPTCSAIPRIEFSLAEKTYPNNSVVSITDIGDYLGEGDALLCVTDNPNCCRNPDGEFYYPDGSAVGFSFTNSIYRNRGEGVVRLNRRNGATSPLGRYRCDVPDATGTTWSIYINIVIGEAPSTTIPPPPVTTVPPPFVPCPPLTSPANGRVTGSTSVGSVASYSCFTGFTLVGSSSRTCQSNGHWSGSAPICQAVQCPTLTNPANGRVTASLRTYNSRATYTCNIGYTLIGSSSRTCQSNGQWSGSAPTCQPVQCPTLTNPANGRVTVSSRSVGGRATYNCNSGYTLSGSSSRTCLSNGQWSGSIPTCSLIPRIEFCLGEKTYPNNSVISITDIGDSVAGGDALLCKTDNPNCCSNPDGEFYYPDGSTVGYSSTNSIYRNRGEGVVRLNRRNGATSPLGRYRCDVPDATGTTWSIYINCVEGGAPSTTIPPPPVTTVPPPSVPCTPLIFPSNGGVTGSTSVGSVASYSCFTGFTLVGSSTRTCQSNGQWSGSAPTCQPVQCPTLTNPANGRVTASLRTYNSRATYTCNIGYTLIGSSSRTCLSNGQWSGSAPTCQVQCLSLTNPANGRVSFTRTSVGGRATYTCNTGYILSGFSSRTCLFNGVWSGSAPTCSPTTDLVPKIEICLGAKTYPNNSEVSITDIGDSVAGGDALLCKTDNPNCCSNPDGEFYYPDGSAVGFSSINSIYRNRGEGVVRLNRRNGATSPLGRYRCDIPDVTGTTWSVYITIISEVTNQPSVVFQLGADTYNNGAEIKITDIGEGDNALLCVTDSTNCCNAQTTLAGEFYSPDGSLVGVRASGDSLYRNRGDKLIRLNRRNGATSPLGRYRCEIPDSTGTIRSVYINIVADKAPSITALPPVTTVPPTPPTCPPLPPPSNGRVSGSTSVGSTSSYFCFTGFTLVGFSRRTCLSNGQWSGSIPTCQPVQCPNLPNPVNGRVTTVSRSYNGRAIYTCNSGYALSGSSSRTCQFNGQWSGSAPTCRPVQCPRLTNPANGEVTVTTRSVGGRATYTCNSGFVLVETSFRFCGARGTWTGTQPSCVKLGFTLIGSPFANTSSVSLSNIGEDERALFFPTENVNCCQTQKIGECYYPDGTLVGVKASPDQIYRNRRSQLVRLNKKPSAGAGGRSAPTGLYCCTVPNKEGTSLQRVCANVTA